MPQLEFFVVGISDASQPEFSEKVISEISRSQYFSGGKRHFELVKSHLPASYNWIDITVPLNDVYDIYSKLNNKIVVFASGDPLFFGFASTLQKEFPTTPIKVEAYFNSIQMLAHRANIPYHNLRTVSLTGRKWHEFDRALIQSEELIGVLTDKKKTPSIIAQRMLQYGYDNYTVYIGEYLGGDKEKLAELSVEDCSQYQAASLNCMLLKLKKRKLKPFGIHESQFVGLAGRPKMITKDAYRLISLSKLGLHNKSVLWDIGFCTGSVSVEAKLQFPHMEIFAFEIRQESGSIIQQNMERFGTPGIEYSIGDFFAEDLEQVPAPDAVFIGGHGGRLFELLGIVHKKMQAGGTIVINAVTDNSRETFIESCTELGMELTDELKISIDEHNPLSILAAQKQMDK